MTKSRVTLKTRYKPVDDRDFSKMYEPNARAYVNFQGALGGEITDEILKERNNKTFRLSLR